MPESAEPRINLATVLARHGETAAAENLYREALAIDPASEAAHGNLADLLDRAGQDVGCGKAGDVRLECQTILGRVEVEDDVAATPDTADEGIGAVEAEPSGHRERAEPGPVERLAYVDVA